MQRPLFLVALFAGLCCTERVPIKINEPAPTYTPTSTQSTPSYTTYSSYTSPPPVRDPVPISLPSIYDSLPDDAFNAIADKWASLDGRCYSWKTEQYTYELCPFRNMTQKSTNNAIMGLWGTWLSGGSHHPLTMHYTDGTPCSSGKRRSTIVRLECDESPAGPYLASVSEPVTCEYVATFRLGLACQKEQPDGIALETATTEGEGAGDAASQRTVVPCRKLVEQQEARIRSLLACITHLLASVSSGSAVDASSLAAAGPCAGVLDAASEAQLAEPAGEGRASSYSSDDAARAAPRRDGAEAASQQEPRQQQQAEASERPADDAGSGVVRRPTKEESVVSSSKDGEKSGTAAVPLEEEGQEEEITVTELNLEF